MQAGQKHSDGRERPHFRSFGSQSDPWVAPAHPLAITVPTVFALSPQKEERRRKGNAKRRTR